jgi:cyanobactin maturation PatA/PatG family protease
VSSLAFKSRGNITGTLRTLRPAAALIDGLTTLWAETNGDPAICIAILDAPVDRANPCLESAKIEERWLGHQPHCAAHGTEVASVVFAPHDTPILGIAPGCRGVSIPIYECDPERSPSTNQRRLARAIHEALAAGARVINVSAGQLVPHGSAEEELSQAVRACTAAGVLIVAAAGNDGCDCLHVPAALPCVLAVGAMRRDGSPLAGSNWGSIYGQQGILAPGEDIPVAGQQGRPELRTGTSFATAIVSGVVALLLSRERKHGRPIRPLLVRKALLAAARALRQTGNESRRFLAGCLNITEAMHLLNTWSTTMTHEDLDLAAQCNLQSDSGSDARPMSVSPSGESVAAPIQPSQHQTSPAPEARQQEYVDAVQPSGCAACRGERQLVYALGQLGHDPGSQSALEAFTQRGLSPFDPKQMYEFLDGMRAKKQPWHSPALLWTLEIGEMPVYVIKPDGPYDREAYELLEDYLKEQNNGDAEVVGVPGVVSGQTQLYNGQQVPVINPDMRGLCNWSSAKLINAAQKAASGVARLAAKDKDRLEQLAEEFLDRIYFEFRNVGRAPQERALNYAGTNLVQFLENPGRLLEYPALDSISVDRSMVSRPGSDCWDVTIAFFNPDAPPQSPRSMRRYTVDVGDVLPVMVGEVRSWKAR